MIKHTITTDGTEEWKQNNWYHRIGGPAILHKNGDESWYENNNLHRVNAPAITCRDGKEYWLENNKFHRMSGPAIIHPYASGHFYRSGEITK